MQCAFGAVHTIHRAA